MRSSQAGFSLLEALIAASIVALIGAALGPTLFAASQVWTGQAARAALSEEDRVARRVLERLTERAVNPGFTGDDMVFQANARSIDMMVRTLSNDVDHIELLWQSTDAGDSLIMNVDPGALGQDQTQTQTVVLLNQVEGGSFAFYGQRGEALSSSWRGNWTDETMPRALRVDYQRKTRAGRPNAAKVIIAPFSAQGPLHCPIDVSSYACVTE